MSELNDYRNAWMTENQKGITDLYNRYYDEPASKLSQLHRALDTHVLKAYGWPAEEDLLSNLLDLNMELTERENQGLFVIGPWDPNRRQNNIKEMIVLRHQMNLKPIRPKVIHNETPVDLSS